ncbi:sugar transferase [uncultured Sphingomonas sp.]|uniref:sugar transferase n=1 Tax=uncultured Sphingomonas sp. TaxID=158754 RepID=UPI003747D56B
MQFERSIRSSRRPTVLDLPIAQLLLLLAAGVALPAAITAFWLRLGVVNEPQFRSSVLGSVIAIVIGFALIRRMTAYPGTGAFGMLLPAFGTVFGALTAVLLGMRINYSGIFLSISFVSTLIGAFTVFLIRERSSRAHFNVVPHGATPLLYEIREVDWTTMERPELPDKPNEAIVADLRYDHDSEWERMLAEAAIRGHPVYHTKQVWESLTGRVAIEHMSENSFGSLLPNLAYRRVKRLGDVVGAFILLPLLLIPMIIIGLLIRLDSKGPVFFVQQRMGYRGYVFPMFKFRTMRPREALSCDIAARTDAITQSDDVRITKIGRFLRRARLDELPQILNVLRGEMSFIGPRPEAVALSRWYEDEIPFYRYRHIVRPGITGWAQVKQGHVAELSDIDQKLSYDFYYIKNFSLWLDTLIVLKTGPTMLSGFGSK